MSARDTYLKKLIVQLDELNAELDGLNAAYRKEGMTEAGVQFEKRVEELRRRREALRQQAAKAEETSEGAWEELREGLERTWEGLTSGFKEAKAEFERGYREGMGGEGEESPSSERKEPK